MITFDAMKTGTKFPAKWLTALLLSTSLITVAQSKREMILSYEKHENVSEDKRRELISFLASRANPDYYVFPVINKRKLRKARKRAYVDKMDVLALIDTQFMGPAKNFLLIGTSGIYFKNGNWDENPGRHFIPFSEFKTKEIKLKGDDVAIGDLLVSVGGSWAEIEFIIALLKDLQAKV